MTDEVEKRMRAALDSAHMPAGLAERTLARIEAERSRTETMTDEAAQSDAAPAVPHGAPARPAPAGGAGKGARRTGRTARRRLVPLVAALAACLMLVSLGVGGVAWAWQPYAYVAIDVNPSIELGINRFDRVAATRSYNDDGAQLLEAADVGGMTYRDAMSALEDALRSYLDDGAAVQMTVTCDDEAMASKLETVGARCLDEAETGRVQCSHASEAEHHEADAAGIGIGKYRVWRQLVDAGDAITLDEAAEMTMRELLDRASSEGIDVSSTSSGCSDAGHHHGGQTQAQAGASGEVADGASAPQHGDGRAHRAGRHRD